MRTKGLAVAVSFAALLAALAAPGASGQAGPTIPGAGIANPAAPANVTLYFHVNGFQEFPINTQAPVDWHQDKGHGLATTSASCASLAEGTPADKERHTWYGYSSPGYVEYDFTPDGSPRTHPERGLSYDVQLAGDGLRLYWYLSTQTGVPETADADPDATPVVVPRVVVRATLRGGSELTTDASGYNEGPIVAQGQTEPALLALHASQGVRWIEVAGHHVYEFEVPLRILQPTIPKELGYNLRIDAFLDNPMCPDPHATGYLMPNVVKVHTSPELRPRMEAQVREAVRIEALHPQFLLDDVVIHATANSPFGNYDVDEGEGGIRLEILDASGRPAARDVRVAGFVQRYHEHDHHTEPVDVTFVWPFRKEGAPDGSYTVRLTVQNDQGTAVATARAALDIGEVLKVTACDAGVDGSPVCREEMQAPDGSVLPAAQQSPAALLAPTLALLAAALALRRHGT